MNATEFRFRFALAKTKKIQTGSKAFLALSGSPSSYMLLDLMARFQKADITAKKRHLSFEDVIVGHVDTSVLFPENKVK
jgi:hypothetical protein